MADQTAQEQEEAEIYIEIAKRTDDDCRDLSTDEATTEKVE